MLAVGCLRLTKKKNNRDFVPNKRNFRKRADHTRCSTTAPIAGKFKICPL